MDIKPYKFEDSANPRIATNIQAPSNINYLSAVIFLASLRVYQRRIFRIYGNAINFALFTGASALASYSYASYFLSSPEIEAGLINNA